jgi:hypothetical protein
MRIFLVSKSMNSLYSIPCLTLATFSFVSVTFSTYYALQLAGLSEVPGMSGYIFLLALAWAVSYFTTLILITSAGDGINKEVNETFNFRLQI